MKQFVWFAEAFMGLFKAGGENLVGLITGTLPLIAVMLTFVTALIKFIGEERVENFCQKLSKYAVARYTIIPLIAGLVLCNPMCFSVGRFMPEKYKASYIDAMFGYGHTLTGLFPHSNPAELFIWLGIAGGVEKLGYNTTAMAVCWAACGVVLALVRGTCTQYAWKYFADKRGLKYE